MSYVLGSDTESIVYTADGIGYQPAGLEHAVDTESPTYRLNAALAYAICGQAVRVWPTQPFDSRSPGVHQDCAVVADGD